MTENETKSLKDYTTEELEAILAERKEQKRQQELARRDAYEAIRAQLVMDTERAVTATIEAVKGLVDFCNKNVLPFREILSEYGQLRMSGQMSFTIQEGDFRVEVKSNKVKKFDERADAAATRLIEFLKCWIEGKEDGQDNPMYQLAMTMLERNKYGDLDYKSISKLYEMEAKFNDEEYSAIMALFKESHLVDGTRENFYFYRRNDMGVWVKLEPSFNRM